MKEDNEEVQQALVLEEDIKNSVKVESDRDAVFAGDVLASLTETLKERREERKRVVDPMIAAKRAADKYFKDRIDPLKRASDYIKGLLLDYEQSQKEQRALAAAAAKKVIAEGGSTQEIAQKLQESVQVTPRSSSVIVRRTWDVEVLDKSKIPLQYLKVDTVALKAYARQTQGSEEVPGVRFFLKDNITTRSK